MSNVPYHAWTHRPKGKGGTDPVAFGLPMAHMANPSLTLVANAGFTDTGLTNFYTTAPDIFQQDDGTVAAPTDEYIDILKPGVYAAFTQIVHVTNNGQIAINLFPLTTGGMFGPSIAYSGYNTTTNFMDADIWEGAFSPFGIDLLAFSQPDLPVAFTAKYKWTNLSGSPALQTFDSPVVLVIVQLTPDYLFA